MLEMFSAALPELVTVTFMVALEEPCESEGKFTEPGTKVTVNVTRDLDKTLGGIKDFTEKYNQVARFANQQFAFDPSTQHAGKL